MPRARNNKNNKDKRRKAFTGLNTCPPRVRELLYSVGDCFEHHHYPIIFISYLRWRVTVRAKIDDGSFAEITVCSKGRKYGSSDQHIYFSDGVWLEFKGCDPQLYRDAIFNQA